MSADAPSNKQIADEVNVFSFQDFFFFESMSRTDGKGKKQNRKKKKLSDQISVKQALFPLGPDFCPQRI